MERFVVDPDLLADALELHPQQGSDVQRAGGQGRVVAGGSFGADDPGRDAEAGDGLGVGWEKVVS